MKAMSMETRKMAGQPIYFGQIPTMLVSNSELLSVSGSTGKRISSASSVMAMANTASLKNSSRSMLSLSASRLASVLA